MGAKWPQLEGDLKAWIVDQRNNDISVSTKMVFCEARKMTAGKGIADFTGHLHWVFRFMKRNGLSMRTRTRLSQKMPDSYQEILEFRKFVIQLRMKSSQTGNMDETPMTSDCPLNRTVEMKGSKSVTVKTTGNEKNQFTAVLCCLADGTKLRPM